MKGDERIITILNALLADELTAINQYMVHSEMCADWGYDRLHEAIEKRAIDEMKHAEQLIGRILYLEGTPIVNELNMISIGAEVAAQRMTGHLRDGSGHLNASRSATNDEKHELGGSGALGGLEGFEDRGAQPSCIGQCLEAGGVALPMVIAEVVMGGPGSNDQVIERNRSGRGRDVVLRNINNCDFEDSDVLLPAQYKANRRCDVRR